MSEVAERVKFCNVEIDRSEELIYRVHVSFKENEPIKVLNDVLIFTNGLSLYGAPELVILAGNPYKKTAFEVTDFANRINYLKQCIQNPVFIDKCHQEYSGFTNVPLSMNINEHPFMLSAVRDIDLGQTSGLRIDINKALEEYNRPAWDFNKKLNVVGVSFIHH